MGMGYAAALSDLTCLRTCAAADWASQGGVFSSWRARFMKLTLEGPSRVPLDK